MTEPMSASLPNHDRFERPSPLWYLAFEPGLVLGGLMTTSQGAYDVLSSKLPLPPRKVVQAVWIGTALVHVAEATYAYKLAKSAGMNRSATRWAIETMVVGFPSIMKLKAVAAS